MAKKDNILYGNKYILIAVSAVVVLLFINQLMFPKVLGSVSGSGGTATLGNFEYGSKITLKPIPLAVGEQPKIAGYKSIIKPLPTIN